MGVPTEIVRRRCEADVRRAELGLRSEPLSAVSMLWERLREEYTPAELAEACRGWLAVERRFAEQQAETGEEQPQGDSPLAAVCRGVLAAAEQLERED